MRQSERQIHSAVLFLVVVVAITAGMFGYYLAATNANRQCAEYFQQHF